MLVSHTKNLKGDQAHGGAVLHHMVTVIQGCMLE